VTAAISMIIPDARINHFIVISSSDIHTEVFKVGTVYTPNRT